MKKNEQRADSPSLSPLDISDTDVLNAMKEINGYLDITPADAKELYHHAYKLAVERLSNFIKARDVMTAPVVSVQKDTPLQRVAEIMARHHISGLPVIDSKGKVVGLISEKDFLRHMEGQDTNSFMKVVAHCLQSKTCVALSMRKQKAADIMSAPPLTVDEHTPVSQIAALFLKEKINRAPVIDQKGTLVGIVSRADIIRSSFPKL